VNQQLHRLALELLVVPFYDLFFVHGFSLFTLSFRVRKIRGASLLPISKDAVDGRSIEINLAVVYAWTNELGLAFEKLSSLTKVPNGIFYGQLKRDPYWEPLRQDPRYEKVLSELAPRD